MTLAFVYMLMAYGLLALIVRRQALDASDLILALIWPVIIPAFIYFFCKHYRQRAKP